MDRSELEKIFHKYGCNDFAWMKASDIEVAQWVRMKCIYGCRSYGNKGTCPPEVPSFDECRRFFSEYEDVALFHFSVKLDDPDSRDVYSKGVNSELLRIEREVFLAGHRKAFLFFMDECQLCAECPGTRHECKNPRMARPCPESFCVDVYATVRKHGYHIEVLKDYDQEMNRYSFLMVE